MSSDREPSAHDTRFSLPSVDAPPSQEVGVILMGQEVESLLAGLGSTTLAADPAVVFLLVDQVWHAGTVVLTRDHLVRLGGHHWPTAPEMHGPALGNAPPLQS